jgi:hypothetical protein
MDPRVRTYATGHPTGESWASAGLDVVNTRRTGTLPGCVPYLQKERPLSVSEPDHAGLTDKEITQ